MDHASERRPSLFLNWLQVALWCGVIFWFSSRPDYDPGKELDTAAGILNFVTRKMAHLGEYAILMFLARRAIGYTVPKAHRWHFLTAYLFVLLYSISDEWHQTFVFGRTGTVRDVFIDSLGAMIGFYYYHRNEKKKARSAQSPAKLEN